MAKGDYLSNNQQKIVKRYYEHKDTLMAAKLGEIVSELYLATDDPKKQDRLWKSATTALKNSKANRVAVDKVLAERNLQGLARLVNELS